MLVLDVSRAEAFSVSMSGPGYIMWEGSQGHPQRSLRQERESEGSPGGTRKAEESSGGTRKELESALGSKEGNVISEQLQGLRATKRRDHRARHSEVTRAHGLERRWGLGEGWRPLARTRDCVSWMVHPAEKGHFPFPKGMLKIVGYTIQLLKGPSRRLRRHCHYLIPVVFIVHRQIL